MNKLEYDKYIPTMLNIEKNTNVHRTLFVQLQTSIIQ